jgi:hypothetical protein
MSVSPHGIFTADEKDTDIALKSPYCKAFRFVGISFSESLYADRYTDIGGRCP